MLIKSKIKNETQKTTVPFSFHNVCEGSGIKTEQIDKENSEYLSNVHNFSISYLSKYVIFSNRKLNRFLENNKKSINQIIPH